MFKTALAFLSPYKLYIYAAVAALVVAGWAFDRHQQYNKGVAACQLKQAEAQASYWEQRGEQLAAQGKKALTEEMTTSENINRRINNSKIAVEKSSELDKSNTNGSCVFSPDELPGVNAAIREANS